MKRVIGLDLGTTSIGWAVVNEAENESEVSSIIKIGVRVNPLTTDEKNNFESGKPISTNSERTSKRGARRNLDRYQLRRENLLKILREHHIITEKTILAEIGENSTHTTLATRAKAAKEKVSLEEFARILLLINKKRGYKSNRKAKGDDEGQSIDGMQVAKILHDENLTPGQYVHRLLSNGKRYIPEFYRSDLRKEFDLVWNFQKQFYPDILDDMLYKALEGKGLQNSRKSFLGIKGIYTAENKGKRDDVKSRHYAWRAKAVKECLPIEEVAYVLVEINNNLNQSSGYLGEISDRSKELYFNKQTVGEYLFQLIQSNRHNSLKNQIFYREDYLDEFEQIWKTQATYYPDILTDELKTEIRDRIIFYQRRLKSQKNLLSVCEFENWEINKRDKEGQLIINPSTGMPKKKRIGSPVIPKSSPLFQEFKIWQMINNLVVKSLNEKETFTIEDHHREKLFSELNIRRELSQSEVLKAIGLSSKGWKTNYEKGIDGNRTNASLYDAYQKIAEAEGFGQEWAKRSAEDIKDELKRVFEKVGIDATILEFDATKDLDAQSSYRLWHLLYATEDDIRIKDEDRLIYGNSAVALKKKLVEKFGFTPEYAQILTGISLSDDYGSLSAKAIKKILPYLAEGKKYSEACHEADYNHSKSITVQENKDRPLEDRMENLPKGILRNPVVEKILNQMVNLVNEITDTYGKADEVRVELARELKRTASERQSDTKMINQRTKENEDIRKLLNKNFGIPNPTKNDIIRYRLWEELKPLGYKDVFTNQYIDKNDLFSKKIDIEHIIPKALIFDDSFSNKTLAFKDTNIRKRDRTAIDFIREDYNSEVENFKARVEELYNNGKGTISNAKKKKLLTAQNDLDSGFIDRDLRNSQYIAKASIEMLQKVFRTVTTTTGSITDRLREDWGIIDVMKELSMPKYRAVGLTEMQERLNLGTGEIMQIEVIKDWTKRNDHRHHAMDALTVAFTKRAFIQYLNHLNARKDEKHQHHATIIAIGQKYLTQETTSSRKVFRAPLPNFREEAKKQIESILVSIKAKNKVVTRNVNKTKKKKGYNEKVQLTPRGQLHKETIYGEIRRPNPTPIKINKKISLENIELIIDPIVKSIILEHLKKYQGDRGIAFDPKTLKKDPLLYKGEPLKEVKCYERIYTIRKEISPDLSVDKVIDDKVRAILSDRLKEFNGNAKEAFSDLDKRPIWLNKEKGISIKRVTISGVSNVESLHEKRDHNGNLLLTDDGHTQPNDFVSTGNNHHVAIYEDENGNYQEKVVSFFEAVSRVQMGLPIVDKTYNQQVGWKFLFTMKQNEMFVIPTEDFDPTEIDLMDEANAPLISKHLYRVQKIAIRNYYFRHHLETNVNEDKTLKDLTYCRINSPSNLKNFIKVRTNHLGKIVSVGEYN